MGRLQHFQLKCLIIVTRMFAGYIRLIIQCVYANMYLYMLHDVRIHVRMACTDVCIVIIFCEKIIIKNTDCICTFCCRHRCCLLMP